MNRDQVWGYARAVLAAVGGYFVAKGKLSMDDLNTVIGAVGVLFVAVWSHFSNKPK